MPESADHLLLFTKYPTPRFAKTRLIPAMGAERAAEISRQLTEIALTTIRNYANLHTFTRIIIHYYTPKDLLLNSIQTWLNPTQNEQLVPQSSGDLGEKLVTAFTRSFSSGATKAVVIGADCPSLTPDILQKAFKALDGVDVVMGPAVDGGYYLLGMKSMHENLFRSIPWSTSTVYALTCEAAKKEGLTITSLQPLRDIDTPEDLAYFHQLRSEES